MHLLPYITFSDRQVIRSMGKMFYVFVKIEKSQRFLQCFPGIAFFILQTVKDILYLSTNFENIKLEIFTVEYFFFFFQQPSDLFKRHQSVLQDSHPKNTDLRYLQNVAIVEQFSILYSVAEFLFRFEENNLVIYSFLIFITNCQLV